MKPAVKIPLLFAGCALAGALLVPPLEPDADGSGARPPDTWTTPPLPRKPDLGAQAIALAGSPLFEAEAAAPTAAAAAAAATPAADPRWRIAGVLRRGDAPAVWLSYSDPSKPGQVLRVGDTLPSGHRIERIEPNTVCVRVGKKIVRLGVQASE